MQILFYQTGKTEKGKEMSEITMKNTSYETYIEDGELCVKPRWYKIGRTKPKSFHTYLVVDRDMRLYLCVYNGKEWFHLDTVNQIENITYFMNPPTLPQQDQ